MKFAAIDVGSNAIRLLLKRIIIDGQETIYKKESLIRIPVRLGEDTFIKKRISQEKIIQLVNSMKGFKHLLEAYEPIDYLALATSAMREAPNGPEIAEIVRKESGIDLRIIDGHDEASIIFSNHAEEALNHNNDYLYIDIGGGSTEMILFAKRKVIAAESFRIGTVRIMQGIDDGKDWIAVKKWLKEVTRPYKNLKAIGSGGNINKIFRFSRKKEDKPLSYKMLKEIKDYIEQYSYHDRIRILRLRPDRADVILPAINTYLSIMEWAGIKKIYVPQIGLADGIIHMLYDQYKKKMNCCAAA